MFVPLILLFISTKVIADSVEISYFESSDKKHPLQRKYITLESNIATINDNVLPKTTPSIKFVDYTGEFIHYIENLNELELIEMNHISLSEVPEFKNLNKIYKISLNRNNIIYIKRQSFSNIPVAKILLMHNKIQKIEEKSFGTNLEILHLRCNDLTTISSWFQAPEKIKTLNLLGNKIKTIKQGVLSKMTSLESLDLEHNQLLTLSDSLPNKNSFYTIQLGHNRLTELKTSWFPSSKFSINWRFTVDFNNLTYIPKDLLKNMNSSQVFIDGNPWQCSCYEELIKMLPWEGYGKFGFKDRPGEPRCVIPLAFGDSCIESNDQESIEYFYKHSSQGETRDYICELFYDLKFKTDNL